MTRLRPHLLTAVLVLGAFQLGRLSERQIWPCRLRSLAAPLAVVVAPLLGQELPSEQLCDLLLRIPGG